MENIDQTIPFVVLVAVGLLLLLLLRRTSAVEAASARASIAVGADANQTPSAGQEGAASAAVADVPPSAPIIAKRRQKRPPVAAPPTEPTPIETAVSLLKQKDTLVAAFLLREIFDRPVSRR